MTTVTFRNGFTVSDDNNSSTTLKNGGHRTRFVPALEGVVLAADESKKWSNLLGSVVYDGEYSAKEYAVGDTVDSAKRWAVGSGVIAGGVYSAKYYAEQSQTFSNSAINAPGTSATSTSPLTIGTGSKTLDIQPGKAFTPGQFVIIADQTTPANYMVGQITAHNSTTGSLTVNVNAIGGVGVGLMNWIISLTALANVAGAATLGGNNSYSGTNTYTSTTTFNAGTTFNSVCNFNGSVDLSGSSTTLDGDYVVRYRASGESSINIETAGVTASDNSAIKLTNPNKTWSIWNAAATGRFYITDGTVTLVDYLPSTDKTVIRKPQRTDAAVAANDLVRKAELDNANVESIITTTQGALSGFRNKIVNGAMMVSQRSSSGTIPGTNTTTDNVYGNFDRWFIRGNVPQPVNINFQSSGGYRVCTLSNSGSAFVCSTNNFVSGFTTRLEHNDVYELMVNSLPITVSFMFRSSVNGLFTTKLKDLTNNNKEFLKTFNYTGNGNPQKITVTFPALPYYGQTPSSDWGLELSIAGVGGGAFTVASEDVSWRTASNSVMVNGCLNWTNSITNTLRIYNVQLEQGSVATPFEQRPYAVELMLCQRYYETGSCKLYVANTTSVSTAVNYRVPKRVTPSLSFGTATGRSSTPSSTEWNETDSFGVNKNGTNAELAFTWISSAE